MYVATILLDSREERLYVHVAGKDCMSPSVVYR